MSYFGFDQPDIYGKYWTTEKLLSFHNIKRLYSWDDESNDKNIYYDLAKAVQNKIRGNNKRIYIKSNLRYKN